MLEQTDIAVATLINKINDVTPHLMDTFRNQINVDYISNLIGLGIVSIALILCVIGLVWAIKTYNKHEEGSLFIGTAAGCGIIIFIIVLIIIGMNMIQMTLNPDYYIIQNYVKPLLTGGNN